MSRDYSGIKTRLDELIRTGQGHVVRTELAKIKPSDVPRELAADFANIARRIGHPEFSLKILRSLVRPATPLAHPATPREIAIYASALSRIGAHEESLALLNGIKNDPAPEVLLFSAFAHIHQWSYAAAIPFLKSYIKHPLVTPYEALIAKLNLAGAYQFTGQHEPQAAILSELLPTTKDNGWQVLHKNSLELAAQSALMRGEWDQARKLLTEAGSVAAQGAQSDFLVRKWRVIADLKQAGPNDDTLSALDRIRGEAHQRNDFETMRECDYYRSSSTKDSERLNFVYFGTPHRSYRQRIRRETESWHELAKSFTWNIGPSSAIDRIFDIRLARETNGAAELKTGQILHRLLACLSTDFYRPLQLGVLFAHLHPGEAYDPIHSPQRVRRTVERLRAWFLVNDIPLNVQVANGTYRLHATGAFALTVPKELTPPSAEDRYASFVEALKARWPYQSFSTEQASNVLQLPSHQTKAVLKWAVEHKRAHVSGRARSTRFRFAK